MKWNLEKSIKDGRKWPSFVLEYWKGIQILFQWLYAVKLLWHWSNSPNTNWDWITVFIIVFLKHRMNTWSPALPWMVTLRVKGRIVVTLEWASNQDGARRWLLGHSICSVSSCWWKLFGVLTLWNFIDLCTYDLCPYNVTSFIFQTSLIGIYNKPSWAPISISMSEIITKTWKFIWVLAPSFFLWWWHISWMHEFLPNVS